MVIAVARGATFKPVTRIYQKAGAVWKEVLFVQYWKRNPAWDPLAPEPNPNPKTIPVTLHDRYQKPPTKVRGVSASHSSGVLAWDASPSAVDYQILRRTYGSAPTIFPTPTTWTSQLSYNVTGLAQDSGYYFTVRARRIGADGSDIISPESAMISLSTGHADVPVSGTSGFYANASKTDSWTSDYNWGANSGGPDVCQGYPKSTLRSRNARGCVKYAYARSSFLAAIPAGVPEGNVSITSAVIEVIHRQAGTYGGVTPAMNAYNCNIDFNSGGNSPNAASGAVGFQAPPVGGNRVEVDLGGWLVVWLREWCRAAPPTNGLMFFRGDSPGQGNDTNGYNGYVKLKEATGTYWRIRAGIAWSYTVAGVAPAWSTTTGV